MNDDKIPNVVMAFGIFVYWGKKFAILTKNDGGLIYVYLDCLGYFICRDMVFAVCSTYWCEGSSILF
jgi:hypothetical protein